MVEMAFRVTKNKALLSLKNNVIGKALELNDQLKAVMQNGDETRTIDLWSLAEKITPPTNFSVSKEIVGYTASSPGETGETWNNWIYFGLPYDFEDRNYDVTFLKITARCGSFLTVYDDNGTPHRFYGVTIKNNETLNQYVESIIFEPSGYVKIRVKNWLGYYEETPDGIIYHEHVVDATPLTLDVTCKGTISAQ